MTPDRYPDDGSYAGGEVVTTTSLHQLTSDIIADKDYMAPYYMGFFNYDDTPRHALCTRVSRTTDGDLIFEEEKPRNHGWGFVTCTGSGGIPAVYEGYVNASGTITRVFSTGTAKFINKACMARYATTNVITLYMSYIVVPKADLDTKNSAARNPDTTNNVYCSHCPGSGRTMPSVTVPFISTDALGDGFDKFYRNESALDFGTITVNGESISISVKAEDFPDNNPTYRKEFTANGTNYVLFAQITYYQYPVYGKYRKAADEAVTNVYIVPFIEHDCLETNSTIAKPDNKWVSLGPISTVTSCQIDIDWWTPGHVFADGAFFNSGSVSSSSICMGSFYVENGIMKQGSEVESYWYCSVTNTIPGYNRDGILRGRHICYNRSSADNIFDIFPMLRPKDIWYAIAPLHKIDTEHQAQNDTNPINSYTTAYSTEIFDNNCPTETRKQDTTANLTPELMPWQIPSADITTNEFNIEDMPAYEPTDNVIEKFTGDSISNTVSSIAAPNNYVTHWVMDKNQIDAFGAYVWKNLLDFDGGGSPLPGVWENIKIAASNYWGTGTLDPAGVMSFVVGLRFYPFELYTQSTATNHKNIYFGTGRLGVPVITSENTRLLNQIAVALFGGVISISGDDAEFLYKDFRDYVGASATMYIPFCGTYQIPISEIEEGAAFSISYQIDMTTGAMAAYVDAIHGDHTYPLIIANGMCGFEVPLSASNANRLNAAILGDAQNAIGAILQPIEHAGGKIKTAVMGGLSAGAGKVTNPSQISGDSMSAGEAMASVTLGPIAAIGGAAGIETGANMLNLASDMMTRPAVGMPLLQGGRGWSALGAPLTAYIQIRRGRYLYPTNYTHTQGKPENRERQINQIRGYAEAVNVDTTGLSCTETERQMIKRILETGFYRK